MNDRDVATGDGDGAIYRGTVVHRRFAPKPHSLRYRLFMVLLDLDTLDLLDRRLRFFSRNRFNLFAFYDRDHLPTEAPTNITLRQMIERHLAGAGIALDGGAISLLSLPRVLGYAFNPLSVYFCHRRDGALAAILYEVSNTFKQRHTYVIPVDDAGKAPIRQRCEKTFYVSPFLDMDMSYDFCIVPPVERVSVAIQGSQGDKRMIAAAFAGERHPLTDAEILKASCKYPLVTLMVLAAIHWEALKLWAKGIGLRSRPAPPAEPATFVTRREV